MQIEIPAAPKPRATTLVGAAAIALAIAFNVPFSILAATFDYPGILRQPAADVLAAFAAGGAGLVLTWYAFTLCALALIGFAPALAFAGRRLDGMTATAALVGALAGLAQAIGLARWVFAVPVLAANHAGAGEAERAALEVSFVMLNQWGGVAIGEHIGQMLTAFWIGLMVAMPARFGVWDRLARLFGIVAAVGITVGLGEGLALALGRDGGLFGMATVVGYIAMSVWLVLSGVGLLRGGASGAILRGAGNEALRAA